MKKLLLLFILTYTLSASNIEKIEKAILSAPSTAVRLVLTSTLAEMYESELRNKFYKQTKVENQKLKRKIKKLYLQSLDPISKSIQLSNYQELLKTSQVKNNYVEELRPTLYDLLAHRALDYFSKSYFGRYSYQKFTTKPLWTESP